MLSLNVELPDQVARELLQKAMAENVSVQKIAIDALKQHLELPDSEQRYFSHPTAVIDQGCLIGQGSKIWHFSHLMPGCELGMECNIGQNVVVSPQVKLGNNVKVQNNVSIYTGVRCEDDVFLGPSMVFTNVLNPRSAINRKNEFAPTLLKQGASIGANATLVCGITIGKFAFIGAGAVVTKDVKDYALMTGNPARQQGWMSEYGIKLSFNGQDNGRATCTKSGDSYELNEGTVRKLVSEQKRNR